MTRPRISRQEASYILQSLMFSDKAIQEKMQRLAALNLEVQELRKLLQVDPHKALHTFNLKDKQAELHRLECQSYELHRHIETHQKLKRKYQAIAEGVAHQGTYRHLSNVFNVWNLHPETTIAQVTA